ncbi:MAG: MFS transporter [Cyanobacteria bacterium SZAS LIN-3]|nr:MFS transporter [Cyanobacteria bacterium SZAS LIN-3]
MPQPAKPQESSQSLKAVLFQKPVLAWAMFDFANSSYTTVVTTAIFNAYFVKTICQHLSLPQATFSLTLTYGIANFLVVATAPVVGAIADAYVIKKRFLAGATITCVICTALLATAHVDTVALAMGLLVCSSFAFGTSENMIAAFLPEIAPPDKMGRISAFGWTVGYLGGLSCLAVCLAYVSMAQKQGQTAVQFVPVTMLFVACTFALASLPAFFWLKEKSAPSADLVAAGPVKMANQAFRHVWETIRAAREYRDLFTFYGSLFAYTCGTTTVVLLATVYAEQVMGFKTNDSIALIMLVNVAAATGAFTFGFIQDKIGSVRGLALSLVLWVVAIILAYLAHDRTLFWIASTLMGISMGGSASAARALVGQLSPTKRAAEFFGLWGQTSKLAAIVGPMSYSLVTYLSGGDYRKAILSTLCFFIAGLVILFRVNEKRGRANAQAANDLA